MADYDEEDEEGVKKNVIPKYKLLYEDPEIDIKLPSFDGDDKLPTEEKKEDKPKEENGQKAIDIIMQSKFLFFILFRSG